MTNARLLSVAVVGLLPGVGAVAGVCLPPSAKPDSPPHYVEALIDALAYAKIGRDRVDPNADVPTLMLDLKLAEADYKCAAAHLSAYGDSPNEMVGLSANLGAKAFVTLVGLNARTMEVLKDLLNDGRAAKLGTTAQRVAEIGAESDEAWKLLPIVAAGATHSLTDGAAQASLVITEPDRARLLSKLRGTFGEEIRGGMRAGQFGLEAAAAALHAFLADQRWRSRPGKAVLAP